MSIEKIYYDRLKEAHKYLESMGDMVGANNVKLSNLLWASSAETFRYMKEYTTRHPELLDK